MYKLTIILYLRLDFITGSQPSTAPDIVRHVLYISNVSRERERERDYYQITFKSNTKPSGLSSDKSI